MDSPDAGWIVIRPALPQPIADCHERYTVICRCCATQSRVVPRGADLACPAALTDEVCLSPFRNAHSSPPEHPVTA
jgi:hypothetical protein